MTAVLQHVRLAGVAAAVPTRRESILECAYGTPESRAKFAAQTGIRERRRTRPGLCTSDLCAAAAEPLLAELGWAREDVDLLVFVSQSPDYRLPATAATLQHRLGLSPDCAAFDVNLGCSGFVYGLVLAGSWLDALGASRALLLAGDTSSVGPPDMAPLFGDAGTAAALERDPAAPPIHAETKTDGSGAHAIMQRSGGFRHPYTEDTEYTELEGGVLLPQAGFDLDGIEVFNFSVREVPPAVGRVLAAAGVEGADVDAFVFHQANRVINDMVAKVLRIPPERARNSLERFGNTSSASIPLTMVTALRERLGAETLTLLLCGFGVGLSWATVLCQTDRIACPELVEL